MNWKQNVLAVAAFAMFALPGYAQPGPSGVSPPRGSSTTGTSTSPQTTMPDSKAAAPGENREAMLLGFIHHTNQGEIEIANLAKENSSSSQVKDFADRIIKDHKSADDQVMAFAKSHNIDLTAARDRMHAMRDETAGHLRDDREARAVGSATGEYTRMAEPPGTGGAGHMQAMAEHKAAIEKLRTLKGPDFDREFAKVMVKDHQLAIDRLTTARSRTTDPELSALVDKLLPTLKQHLTTAQKLQDSLAKS